MRTRCYALPLPFCERGLVDGSGADRGRPTTSFAATVSASPPSSRGLLRVGRSRRIFRKGNDHRGRPAAAVDTAAPAPSPRRGLVRNDAPQGRPRGLIFSSPLSVDSPAIRYGRSDWGLRWRDDCQNWQGGFWWCCISAWAGGPAASLSAVVIILYYYVVVCGGTVGNVPVHRVSTDRNESKTGTLGL